MQRLEDVILQTCKTQILSKTIKQQLPQLLAPSTVPYQLPCSDLTNKHAPSFAEWLHLLQEAIVKTQEDDVDENEENTARFYFIILALLLTPETCHNLLTANSIAFEQFCNATRESWSKFFFLLWFRLNDAWQRNVIKWVPEMLDDLDEQKFYKLIANTSYRPINYDDDENNEWARGQLFVESLQSLAPFVQHVPAVKEDVKQFLLHKSDFDSKNEWDAVGCVFGAGEQAVPQAIWDRFFACLEEHLSLCVRPEYLYQMNTEFLTKLTKKYIADDVIKNATLYGRACNVYIL